MIWRPWAYEKLDAVDEDKEADRNQYAKPQDNRLSYGSVFPSIAIAFAILLSIVSLAITTSHSGIACQSSLKSSTSSSSQRQGGYGEPSATGYGKAPNLADSNQLYTIPEPIYDCGTSYSEAKAKGCIFDPVISGWQDPICSSAGAKEFLDFAGETPYEFYADKNGTILLSEEERSKTAYWYSTRRYHVSHCLFMMIRAFRAVEAGERFSFEQFGSAHAQHCVKNILSSLERFDDGWNEINAHGASAFVRC